MMPISSPLEALAVQGGADSSEFRIPDSELEGSVELRVPGPQSCRLTPVPSDKILFPRRMLYVEAVLYATVAVAAFGLGYLTGRGSPSASGKEEMRGVEGQVWLIPHSGAKRGDVGAVVIVLPADKSPIKMPLDGLRPDDPGDAKSIALANFGGAVARTNASGSFELSVPSANSYRILVLRHAIGEPVAPLEKPDISELRRYFDAPTDFGQHYHFGWLTSDLRQSGGRIDVAFAE